MRRKTYASPFPRPTPPRKVRDPYLYVLICQTALCLLLLLSALALREAGPSVWQELKIQYEQLLMSVNLPEEGLEQMASDALNAMKQFVGKAAQDISPKASNGGEPLPSEGAQSENGPQGDAGDAEAFPQAVGTALPTMENLEGMGGSGTPENCTFAPMLLTASLDPPIGGRMTSGYGWRIHPITENDDFHRGIDIAAAQGSAVRAVLPGVVSEVGESAIYGNYVRIDHGHGLQTAYSHCETIVARQGENLRKGELVATVGSTGVSTGPHVHFEILKNGVYYNPAWVTNGLTKYGN